SRSRTEPVTGSGAPLEMAVPPDSVASLSRNSFGSRAVLKAPAKLEGVSSKPGAAKAVHVKENRPSKTERYTGHLTRRAKVRRSQMQRNASERRQLCPCSSAGDAE